MVNYNIETKHILNTALHMTDSSKKKVKVAEGDAESLEQPGLLSMALLSRKGGNSGAIALSHVAGTCLTSEVSRLKKMVFRATKGIALTYVKDIETPIITYLGTPQQKSVFFILFQDNEVFARKIQSICDAFQSKRVAINVDNIFGTI